MKKRRNPPEREIKIGLRLKEVREFFRLSQREFADKIGIKRVRLASYEVGRVPLRWEIALRVCHRFQVSEPWLAAYVRTGLVRPNDSVPFGNHMRLAMFLPSDPVLEKLRPGALFSESFDKVLNLEYWKLLGKSASTWMRFDFSNTDDPEQVRTKTEAALTTWFSMIPTHERVRFCTAVMKCGALLFTKLNAPPFPRLSKPAAVTEIEKAIEAQLEYEGLRPEGISDGKK